MDFGCFIDESWHDAANEKIGVLAAVVCSWDAHNALEHEMFRVRRKYYGEDQARDKKSELKGTNLFSNASFKHEGYSKNLSVAREILEFADRCELKIAACAVYGENRPHLLSPTLKQLAAPFRELCVRIMATASNTDSGSLIFDQRLGAQEDISISIHNYLAGIPQPQRLRPIPLIAVSNICAGLQLADIAAHIIGRYSTGDNRFELWYKLVKRLQIEGVDHRCKKVFGLFRQQWLGGEDYKPRTSRTKK